MKKIKLIIFILLIISFLIVLFYGIFGTSLSYLSVKEIKEYRVLKEDLINELIINNSETIYDKSNNTYYYMVSEGHENNIYVLKLELEKGLKYKIINETLNVINVDYSKPLDIIIYNDKYYYETKIQLTNLPIINIETQSNISTNYINTVFKYINTDSDTKVITRNTKTHVRGASSLYLDKKSYKVKFYDETYTDTQKTLISNFYYGKALILDAVYRDKSKVRNFLSTELWNDVSDDFSDVNIYSEYVELFINNEYKGLYVLTEPINRTKLNLNKESENNSSVVIKTNGWRTIGTNTNFKNIQGANYIDYEIKYPDNEGMYSKVWENFLSIISDFYNPEVITNDEVISNTFDINNYIDITIFNSFTSNIDSALKRNVYFYMDDINSDKVYIQPWDMEFSYGYYLDETILETLEYDKMPCALVSETTPSTNKLIINRYWELRKTILTKEYFDTKLDQYKIKLTKGATLRDSSTWNEYDIEKEIEDVRTWLHKRLEFFDEYVESLEYD